MIQSRLLRRILNGSPLFSGDSPYLVAMSKVECCECGARKCKLYRGYGSFPSFFHNLCNACITDNDRGWRVPFILNAEGSVPPYFSGLHEDHLRFEALPEASTDGHVWLTTGWSDESGNHRYKPEMPSAHLYKGKQEEPDYEFDEAPTRLGR